MAFVQPFGNQNSTTSHSITQYKICNCYFVSILFVSIVATAYLFVFLIEYGLNKVNQPMEIVQIQL